MERNTLSRRDILVGGAGAAAGLALGRDAQAAPKAKFSFVHITDTHIQPELGATQGVRKAFDAVRGLKEKPAFGLVGGDLVMDANLVDRRRADLVYDLWQQAAADLKLPLHYSIGNHDAYAISGEHRAPNDPDYAKSLWKKQLGLSRSYDTFDHQGWRFVTLDSVAIAEDGAWSGALDDAQIKWLDDLLRKTDRAMPTVFLTHVPLMTIYGQYTAGTTTALSPGMVVKNGKQFQEMIQGRNVKAVFQGHTHVVEECSYLGTRYVTGGAVCGEWWKGKRLGVHPEGFVVATVDGDDLSWRYVPYGWDAIRDGAAPPPR